MHRLIILSVEYFIRSHYGAARWRVIRSAIGALPEPRGWHGPDPLRQIANQLGQPYERLLDDLGAWLARIGPMRQLLRFMGDDYVEFLHALEELPARMRMLLPEFNMPKLQVQARGRHGLQVIVGPGAEFWPLLLGGVLRAMADDHGMHALITVEKDEIAIDLVAGLRPGEAGFPLRAGWAGGDDCRH